MKTALITGITGQDGQYLSEHLHSLDYKVYGLMRGQNNPKHERIKSHFPFVEIVEGDLLDQSSLVAALEYTQPHEVYNLGAISFVGLSWNQPVHVGEVTGLGVVRMLEAIKMVNKKIKFYQASSSEMFGKVREVPQNESTPFHPRSPYGSAKAYGHYMTVNYRESYGMYTCNGILFNHESPRRGYEFVTRKITSHVAKIKLGKVNELALGNLESKRDWGYAADYVKAMHLMMQQKEPTDYVIATGESHSVKEFCNLAFSHLGLDYKDYVKVDQRFMRPAEVDLLIGDASKAKKELGWKPSVNFEQLVKMMVDADMALEASNIIV